MTIFRGPGGGGNATSDSEVNTLTALTNQALVYSEQAGLEADAAAASAAAASNSAASSASSASAALASETEAALSESAAAISASNSLASENNAATSASTATTQAGIATTQAGLSAASAAAALVSEGNASTSASTATTQAGIATTGAGTATTQAGLASTSAAAALVSEGASAASAAAALASEGAAATSASNAATSETNAATSASEAAASAASINDANLVHKTGDETIGGIKTFSSTIIGSVSGNAATVTTNANLTGAITSVGNATTLSNAVVTSAKLSADLQASTYGMKNRIINGDMRIDQRNAGASVTTSSASAYPVDRFVIRTDTANGTAQRSTTAPAGFVNSLVFTSGTGASPGAAQPNTLSHRIEGFNVADFGWGTANAQPITLSFWVRSSLTGTFAFRSSNGSRSYIATYTISSANTFELKTITIPGDTSGTWATDNSVGMYLNWDVGSGSNFNAASANTWLVGDFLRVSGAVSLVGTSGATFYITGVQLEKGSTATSFDYRDYGRELIMCQRYFELMNYSCSSVSGGQANRAFSWPLRFSVVKRVAPTIVFTSAVVNRCTNSGASQVSINGFSQQLNNTLVDGDDFSIVAAVTATAEL